MGNRVSTKRDIIGHYIGSQFLVNKIWDDGAKYIIRNPQSLKQTIKICEISTYQVNRVIKPLDKNDLIAILLKISPEYRQDYQYIHKHYSIQDLNYLIRFETYKNTIDDMSKQLR
jgi:hypothetical protein